MIILDIYGKTPSEIPKTLGEAWEKRNWMGNWG